MASTRTTLQSLQRSAARTRRAIAPIADRAIAGFHLVWDRPLVACIVLLIPLVLLANLVIQQTFKPYTNCDYLITHNLGMPDVVCNGFDATLFSVPGLRSAINPPLEFARSSIAWAAVLAFATLSLYLTLILNNLKTIVKLLTFNKQTWNNFLSGARTWLVIFLIFCAVFYFSVTKMVLK